MAKLSNDGKYVTVESGDCLWNIARDFLGSGSKYKQLAQWNNIQNPNLIYVGQKVYLSADGGGSSTNTSSKNPNAATITAFGIDSSNHNQVFAYWSWDKDSQTKSYKVLWQYCTLDGHVFGSPSEISVDEDYYAAAKQSTFTIPSGAQIIYFKVKPISKTKSNTDSSVYFTGEWSEEKQHTVETPLDVPGGNMDLSIDGSKLTIEVNEFEPGASKAIKFRLIKNDTVVSNTTNEIDVTTDAVKDGRFVSYVWSSVEDGCSYKVCYQGVKGALSSEWSGFSNTVTSRPKAPGKITSCKALDETTIYLSWEPSATATGYEIQYTNKKEYFDASGDVQEVTTENTVHHFTSMRSGEEYFFRVRAINDDSSVESPWTEIASVKLGAAPAAPTTWSSTTTATVGEVVNLYWVHNSEDGSSETWAELELYIDGALISTQKIQNTNAEDEKDATKVYPFITNSYEEGTTLEWRVRTKGIIDTDAGWGDWSIKRKVDIYAQPGLNLRVTDVNENDISEIASFPFYIKAVPSPETQTPISYHVSITSNEEYETVDAVGNPMVVNVGDEVYSRYFDTNFDLITEMSAGNVNLERNVTYTITVAVTMDSGLNAEASTELKVTWTEIVYSPNAAIGIDTEAYTAYITPYCEDIVSAYRKVTESNGVFTKTDTDLGYVVATMQFCEVEYSNGHYTLTERVIDCPPGQLVPSSFTDVNVPVYRTITDDGATIYYYERNPAEGKHTTTGEKVQFGVDKDGNEVLYCVVEVSDRVTNVTLAVYRREFDGTFTEIASGLDGSKNVTVTDPHPALDYARYRIVATSADTGAVGYYDMPGHPVGGKAVIIQWDEAWTSFEVSPDDETAESTWSGSLLKLPYNIDVSDSHNPDVSLVNYIGRAHPVSYYGTHRGESANWNVNIDKDDKETLYALRRLAIWMGDVYVREPSGSGYWAHVTVSFSQKHKDKVIPVSLTITRVEGGM